MIKSLFSIFLLFVVLFQNVKIPLLYLNYEINVKAITDKFCVNKEKPKLACNGKCYLSKQIKAAEKQNEKSSSPENKKIVTTLFFQEIENLLFNGFCASKQNFNSYYLEKVLFYFHSTIYRPPKIV